MSTIALIVEGHGEIQALPILVRRIASEMLGIHYVKVLAPHRVPRGKLAKEDELKRAVEAVARRLSGDDDAILIMLDADEDCPKELGPELLSWAVAQRNDRRLSVVVAQKEYEAWFVASAASLETQNVLLPGPILTVSPEELSSPKAWISSRLKNGYSETVDQPSLTSQMDLSACMNCNSFDKLVRDLRRLLI